MALAALTIAAAGVLRAQTVAGFRASRLLENYPGGQFPGVTYWPAAGGFMAQKFPGAVPGGVWIVSLYQGAGVTELQFPGAPRPNIVFSAADSSEAYLTMLDSAGAKIWLQVEPGAASVDTLIDLVLARYQHHPCVAGFGVDVEWFQANTHANGKQVTDAEALSWETRVKSHNAGYTLFLKHWLTSKMPPVYRGGIFFIDDSQGFASLGAMAAEFQDWGAAFPANPVGFQYGYPADSVWWRSFPDPMRSIGEALQAAVPNTAGLFWVDFTINTLYPVPQSWYVSPSGSDLFPGTEAQPWKTIQHGANSAAPGSTVFVRAGVYNEKVSVNVSGSAAAGPVTFQRYVNESAVIDGTGKTGDQIILIENRSYVTIAGLELRNNLNQAFGSGIWVRGAGSHIVLRDNVIHDMRAAPGGGDAMAISVYGTDGTVPLSSIVIDGNRLYDCEPGHSETLTLNGNVDTFAVTNNVIHDVDNIGIDMIGGEGTSPSSSTDAARNGLCSGNSVLRARSNYGGGYAAGIYVDGGRSIVVERNAVSQCDVGMEIGCENPGRTASGIVVRDNLLFGNDKAGLGFGGYDFPQTGRVTTSSFTNNTLFANDVLATGTGELWIQYAEGCTVKNNIFSAGAQNRLMTTTVGNSTGNILDHNLWFAPGGNAGSTIDWDGTVYAGYSAYAAGTGQDAHSLHADPRFVSVLLPDLHLQANSPAIDGGDPLFVSAPSETDVDGNPRVVGTRVDIGASEKIVLIPGPPAAPELLSAVPGNASAALRWRRNTESDFGKYRIYGGYSSNSQALLDSVPSIMDTLRTIGGLANNVPFYVRVTAVDLEGEESSSSNELVVTPSSGSVPGAPQLVVVTPDSAAFHFRWRASADASSYQFQCSAVNDFATLAAEDSALAETTAVVTALADSSVYFWRVRGANALGSGPWSEVWNVVTTGGNVAVGCLNRWNLLSVPAIVPDPRRSVLFPTAVSSAFAYDEGYAAAESLWHGRGYWMKFAGAQTVRFSGSPIASDTVIVHRGWNIVGSLTATIAAAAVVPLGTAIASAFFSYEGGYALADSIRPGKAYWVKASADGQLVLSDQPSAEGRRAPAEIPSQWSTLSVRDALGNSQTLYAAPLHARDAEQWTLPPPPPPGVFDVRFASDRMVETAGPGRGNEAVLVARSVKYPLTIEWKSNISGVEAFLGESGEALADGSAVTLDESAAEVRMRFAVGRTADLPESYELAQNFPNPFNGGTQILFTVPSRSHVRLTVYDLLGRVVAQLADEELSPGRYVRTWDVHGASSGVYFCMLNAGASSLVRSMLYMK